MVTLETKVGELNNVKMLRTALLRFNDEVNEEFIVINNKFLDTALKDLKYCELVRTLNSSGAFFFYDFNNRNGKIRIQYLGQYSKRFKDLIDNAYNAILLSLKKLGQEETNEKRKIIAKKIVTEYESYVYPKGLSNRQRYTFNKYFGDKKHETLNCILLVQELDGTYSVSANYNHGKDENLIENHNDYLVGKDIENQDEAYEQFNALVKRHTDNVYSEGYSVEWEDFPPEAKAQSFEVVCMKANFAMQEQLFEIESNLDNEEERMSRSEMISALSNVNSYGDMLDTFELEVCIDDLTAKYY